jgi:phosphosulfolactate phosphohydrolase-like enzyme
MSRSPEERAAARVGIVVDVVRATSPRSRRHSRAGYERVLCCAEIDEARALRASSATKRWSAASGRGRRRRLRRRCIPRGVRARREGAHADPHDHERHADDPHRGARCEVVLLGSLLNLSAVVAAARAAGGDVAILCSGFKGAFALDDAYCAGRFVQALGGQGSDAAIAADVVARQWPSPLDGLNARTYGPPGLEADIEYCAQVDLLTTVPRFERMVGPAAEIVA